MLTNITLENFKCFQKKTQFPLKQINLLTGINGRGKSTLLQSLLLMRQSIDYHFFVNKIILNGNCVKLGDFEDIRNSDISRDKDIILKYRFAYLLIDNEIFIDDEIQLKVEYILEENEDDNKVANIRYCSLISSQLEINDCKVEPIYLEDENNNLMNLLPIPQIGKLKKNKKYKILDEILYERKLFEFFKNIHYIAADRIGPQDFYLQEHLPDFINVGARGENTINLLDKRRDLPVNEELCLGDDAQTLLTQAQEWLKEIFEGATLDIPKTLSPVIEPLFNTDSSKNRYKGSNIGFGYSYILPIIVSGLIAKPGEVLIVENPEAHLHPRAQSRLVRFLAKVSRTGVQIFIETHSDHILNALRIAVYDMLITNEEANILYFPPEIGQPIIQIPIQENGRIENWPPGFFDQMDEDFKVLFGV
jgi:predicted ATPase